MTAAFGIAAAGCVSEKKAQMEARQAYIAGQAQAAQSQLRAREAEGPVVFVQGPVQNHVIAWSEGMTLSKAIVDANYTAFMNPEVVQVMRGGQLAGQLKGIDLLHHQDLDLQQGDTVIILP
ncbi:MAG TPA: hypothetical protein VH619_08080 [Verrucomicrobiae bacterium]|nr:hypothetical protein [Verrucomicrobiae bacterium]